MTCPAGDYPTGINYGGAVDLTLTADPGVNVVRTALGAGFNGIGISNSDGLASIIAPDVNIDISSDPATNNHYGVSASTAGAAADASASAGGTILVLGTDNLFGVYAQNVGPADGTGNATASLTSGSITVTGSTDGGSAGVYAATSGTGTATAEANGDVTASLTAGQTMGGVYATSGEGDAVANFGGGTMTVTGARAYGLAATSNTGSVTATSTEGSTIIIAGSDTVGGQQAVYLNTAGTEADGAAVTATIASTIANQRPGNVSRARSPLRQPDGHSRPFRRRCADHRDLHRSQHHHDRRRRHRHLRRVCVRATSPSRPAAPSAPTVCWRRASPPIAAAKQAPPEEAGEIFGGRPQRRPRRASPVSRSLKTPAASTSPRPAPSPPWATPRTASPRFRATPPSLVDAGDINASGMGSNGVVAVSAGAVAVTITGDVQGGWVPAPDPEEPPAEPRKSTRCSRTSPISRRSRQARCLSAASTPTSSSTVLSAHSPTAPYSA